MASSVSSERAFSQGGITVSKHQNRLKGDIVEALQCVKCSIRHDLIFRDPEPSSALETEWNDDDGPEEEDRKDQDEDKDSESWDTILGDDDNIVASDEDDGEDFDVDIDSGSDID